MDHNSKSDIAGLGVQTPKPSPPGRLGTGSGGAGDKNVGKTDIDGGLIVEDALSSGDQGYAGFSVYTSLNILRSNRLTDEEIDYEVKHLQTLDPSKNFRTRFPSITVKQELLDRSLNSNLGTEIQNIVTNYDNFVYTLSCSLKEAQKHIDELNSYVSTDSVTDSSPAVSLVQDPPVSVLNLDFEEISLEDVLNVVNFTDNLTCYREAAYYGSHEYTYGRVRHDPAPYPDHPIFNNIFDKLSKVDKSFTRENFTCLVTKYEGGRAHITAHSDDENCIDPTSNIYTISFGATRVLNMYTMSGDLRVHDLDLKHGMVHSMTRQSQDIWRHAINRELDITDTRVSFTFRHIPHIPSTDNIRHNIPNIAKPAPPADCNNKSRRVLFLTDSIYSSTPEQVFSSIPGCICVKKVNYQFKDILNFEPYFNGTDTVIFSAGVNDLSRYRETANSLADLILPNLAKCCQRNPNTKFIFNSVLHSNYCKKYDWLNDEIDLFNYHMRNFCRNVSNIYYFDSHSLLGQSNIQRVWNPYDNNGIHITLDARKLVTRELVNCVRSISGSPYTRIRSCRWLLFHRNTPRWLHE